MLLAQSGARLWKLQYGKVTRFESFSALATAASWAPSAGSTPVCQARADGQPGERLPANTRRSDVATVTELGQTGLQGWREKVADGISRPVAKRAPIDEDQVRAVVGATFFVLAVIYVVKTISAATRQAR
jgi:hypothetical protein